MVTLRVFIDTSILDRENHNFQSRALLSFIEAAKELEVVLVLPATTKEEILRHQEEAATKVNKDWMKLGCSPHLKRVQKGPFDDLEEVKAARDH